MSCNIFEADDSSFTELYINKLGMNFCIHSGAIYEWSGITTRGSTVLGCEVSVPVGSERLTSLSWWLILSCVRGGLFVCASEP